MAVTSNRYGGRRNMRGALSTRRGTAVAAATCAVLAAAILLIAAISYKHSVNAEQRPETVLVATGVIQKGTAGAAIASAGLFRPEQLLSKQVTTGAVADAAALNGKVALHDIQPNQQLTLSDFGSGEPYVSELAPNQRAISVPLDASHGLTGVVRVGDRVDVYAGVVGGGNNGGAVTGAALRLLVPNVQVMSVSQNSGGGIGSSSGANSVSDVVLKIGASQAGLVALAADNGKIWLVLRGANAVQPSLQSQIYTINSLLLGTKPVGVKP